MEGPFDEPVMPRGEPAARAGLPETETGRPPGGKAVLRLLEQLQQRGYHRIAAQTVEMAAPAGRQPELRARLRHILAPPGTAENANEGTPSPRDESPPAEEGTVGGDGHGDGSDAEAGDASFAAPDIARAYAAAAKQVTRPRGVPTASGPQWRSLGPWTIPNGQTYGASRVNVSGRVSCVAVDPAAPAHLLCGAAAGGVWESFDRGGSWAPRTDYAATLTVGALTFDPRAPSTVYCGTGEGNFYWWLGAGLLRSTDGGTTWSVRCTAPFVGQGFYQIVVHPANSNRLLAATTGGLYTSEDRGLTWTRRRAVLTWSISVVGTNSTSEILAGCRDGVFRSADAGVTWTNVAMPGGPAGFDRIEVAIARSNPAVAYAWGAGGATVYFYRRSGGAWTAQALPPGATTSQAWYDWYLAAAPDRDNQVFCGGIESYRGTLAGSAWSWQTISNKGASGDSIHPDQHAIAFEPGNPNTIYVGCDGGLYRSPDRGVTWASCNNGMVISEFEYLAQNLGSSRWILGGTQDNGTQRWTGAPSWTHVADGDGGDCAVNRTTPTTVFHTYYVMSPERSTTGGDFGSWAWLPPPVPPGEDSLFYPPFEASASNGDTVAMGGAALYISRNNMSTWTRLAFPSAALSSALSIPNANRVYVGTTDGRVYRSDWNGAAWSALTVLTTPRANAYVSDLLVDPWNPNRIWATYSTVQPPGGRVFRSENGGTTWTDCSAGLPGLPANAIAVDPTNTNRAWLALDVGVYQSFDSGATWTDFSASLPNALIGDILFHPAARVLRVGTRNRGVWEIPVDGWQTNPICGRQWQGVLNPSETKKWFTFNWPATWHVAWTVMPTTIAPGAVQVTWTVQVERATAEYVTYWIQVQNLTNTTVNFDGRFCILSQY